MDIHHNGNLGNKKTCPKAHSGFYGTGEKFSCGTTHIGANTPALFTYPSIRAPAGNGWSAPSRLLGKAAVRVALRSPFNRLPLTALPVPAALCRRGKSDILFSVIGFYEILYAVFPRLSTVLIRNSDCLFRQNSDMRNHQENRKVFSTAENGWRYGFLEVCSQNGINRQRG